MRDSHVESLLNYEAVGSPLVAYLRISIILWRTEELYAMLCVACYYLFSVCGNDHSFHRGVALRLQEAHFELRDPDTLQLLVIVCLYAAQSVLDKS